MKKKRNPLSWTSPGTRRNGRKKKRRQKRGKTRRKRTRSPRKKRSQHMSGQRSPGLSISFPQRNTKVLWTGAMIPCAIRKCSGLILKMSVSWRSFWKEIPTPLHPTRKGTRGSTVIWMRNWSWRTSEAP